MPTPKATVEKTLQLRSEVVRLARAGLSDEEIAARVGRSLSQVSFHRRKGGVIRRNSRSLPEATVAEIHRRYEEDQWPPGEIGRTLGLSPATVHYHLGATTTGKEYQAVARWARLRHPELHKEIMG